MKTQHVVIIIVIVLMAAIAPLYMSTNLASVSGEKSNEYTNYVYQATQAAMESAYATASGEYLFSSRAALESATNTYYETLMRCFAAETRDSYDLIKTYTPCIFLIDQNGFYVGYSETYTDHGLTYTSDIISTIHKWVRKYDGYTVEFHLDDTVVVEYLEYNADQRKNVGKIYSGTRADVLKKIGSPTGTKIYALLSSNDNDFHAEKNDVIINEMQDKMEYYINLHDTFFNQKNDFQYSFTLPKVTGEDWGRLLDQPTIIGFLQGIQLPYDDEYLNVYGFTGHEVAEEKLYCIKQGADGTLYYHEDDCPTVNTPGGGNAYKKYTMVEAAKKGAFPADDCVR